MKTNRYLANKGNNIADIPEIEQVELWKSTCGKWIFTLQVNCVLMLGFGFDGGRWYITLPPSTVRTTAECQNPINAVPGVRALSSSWPGCPHTDIYCTLCRWLCSCEYTFSTCYILQINTMKSIITYHDITLKNNDITPEKMNKNMCPSVRGAP